MKYNENRLEPIFIVLILRLSNILKSYNLHHKFSIVFRKGFSENEETINFYIDMFISVSNTFWNLK